MSANPPCRRPGCAGTIQDGYCDVCGLAPAGGAPPLVPATGPAPTGPAPTAPSASGATATGVTATGATLWDQPVADVNLAVRGFQESGDQPQRRGFAAA